MKFTLDVTVGPTPLRYATGAEPDWRGDFKGGPGTFTVLPDPEPIHVARVDAEGMSVAGVVEILRATADRLEADESLAALNNEIRYATKDRS